MILTVYVLCIHTYAGHGYDVGPLRYRYIFVYLHDNIVYLYL